MADSKTKYKYLLFRECQNKGKKTRRFEVYNHVTECFLGMVMWDVGWRQYVLCTPNDEGGFKFSQGCHDDFAHFLRQLNMWQKLQGTDTAPKEKK